MNQKSEQRKRFFRSAVVQNALSLFGIQAVNNILPWFTFPYVIRILGADKFGRIAFATAFVSYFQVITEYGFNFTATREISIHRDNPQKLSEIFTATMAAKALLMTASLLVMTAIVFSVPRFRAEAPLFYITFSIVVANVVFPVWLFQGIEKMGQITYREIAARLLGLAPTFLFVKKPSDYLVVAAIQNGSLLFAGAVGYIGFRRITQARLTRVSWREIQRTFVEGWHVFLSTAAINLYTRSNTFLLGLFAPEAEVGYFSAAQRAVEAARALSTPLTTAIYPHISRIAHESPEQGVGFIRRNAMRVAGPFILITLGLLVGAPLLVFVLFGHRFGPTIPLLRIMSPIPFVVAIGSIYSTFYMLGMGYKKQWSQLIISAGAFNFIALFTCFAFARPTVAVAITSVVVEVWVTAGAYLFYRWKEKRSGASVK